MSSASLPGGTAAASSRSRMGASAPSSGPSVPASHRRTDPPLLIDPPTTQSPGTSAKQKSRPRGSVTGRSTQSRSAPLVPIEHAATPGRTAPTPRLASGPSPAPATTGSPAGRPVSRAAAAVSSRRSVVATSSPSCPGSTPPRASASASQSPRRRSSSPVPEAVERSTAKRPVSRVQDELLDAAPAPRPRDDVGGVGGEPAQLGQRRHRVQRGPRAAVEVRVGAAQVLRLGGGPHVGPGQQARQRPAVGVEGAQPVHGGADRDARDPRAPVPRGRGRVAERATAPSTTSRGSSSTRPGAGSRSAKARSPAPCSRPCASKATAFALVVPTSSPRTTRTPTSRRARRRPEVHAALDGVAVDRLELVRGELEAADRAEAVLELRDGAGADERRRHARVAQRPRDRQLRERLAPAAGDLVQRRERARGSPR